MSFSLVTSNWFRLSFPLLLLTLISLGMSNVISITKANIDFASNLPFVLFVSVILLGHAFKQSRIAMVSTAMLTAYWIIINWLQVPLSSGTTLLELSLLAFLLPVACLLVYPLSDSGILSKTYLGYTVTISLFISWCYLILTHYYDGGFENIDDTFLFIIPEISRLPFILVLYLVGLILCCAILVLRQNRITDAVVYSSIMFASVTFIFFHVPYISSTMFTIAGLLLLVYVISASYELAFNDRLTSIPGRLALESDLKLLGRKYTIAMLDIDHFKSFNDTYGHDTGDDVLRLVASKLRDISGKAKVYRYGGEEFTVLFRGKHVDDTVQHLELLRESVESYDMVLRNSDSRPKSDKKGSQKRGAAEKENEVVNVTISIGVSDNSEHHYVSQVMKAADEALYKAKKAGRNKVVTSRKLDLDSFLVKK